MEIKEEEDRYKPIPKIDNITPTIIQENYLMIKADIQGLIDIEINVLKERQSAESWDGKN